MFGSRNPFTLSETVKRQKAARKAAAERAAELPPETTSEGDVDMSSSTSRMAAPDRNTVGESISTSDVAQMEDSFGKISQASKTSTSYGAAPEFFTTDLIQQQMSNNQRILVEEEIRSFATGLITDLSPLQEVSNGSIDEQNMEIIEDGSRARRRGINYETSFARYTTAHVNVQAHLWQHAEDGSPYIAVLRADGSNLSTAGVDVDIFDASDAITISDTRLDQSTSNALYYDEIRSLSEWGSDLYIPQGSSNTFDNNCGSAIYYSGSTLTTADRPVYIRDHWGVDDGLGTTERPNTLDANHLYNLVNQGWTWEDIESFESVVGDYPSNADMPWYGKLGNAYQATELNTLPSPNGAPKGSVIISAQSFDRSDCSLVANAFTAQGSLSMVNIDTDDDQSLTWKFCSEFGGRIVWACTRNSTYNRTASSNDSVPDMETILFYSRSVTHQAKSVSATDPVSDAQDSATAFTCYSTVDPTSEFYQAAPSDGGFYAIPEVGKVMGMRHVGGVLVLLADNGIWALSGEGGLFDPVNSILRKISNVGCE